MGIHSFTIRFPALVLVLVGGWCLVAPRTLQAQGVTYVAQERSVAASVRDEWFGGDPPDRIVTGDFKEAKASDFGPFDAAVTAQAEGTGFPSGYSSVSQHSRLEPTGIRVTGDWSNYAASNEGTFAFQRVADVTFDVAGGPIGYDLAYSLRDPSTRGYSRVFDLYLSRVGGDGGDVFRVTPQYDGDTYTATGTASGVLSPGRYEFRYFSSYLGDVGENGQYSVQLGFAAVPEPGAAALALLGGAVLVLRRRRLSWQGR